MPNINEKWLFVKEIWFYEYCLLRPINQISWKLSDIYFFKLTFCQSIVHIKTADTPNMRIIHFINTEVTAEEKST